MNFKLELGSKTFRGKSDCVATSRKEMWALRFISVNKPKPSQRKYSNDTVPLKGEIISLSLCIWSLTVCLFCFVCLFHFQIDEAVYHDQLVTLEKLFNALTKVDLASGNQVSDVPAFSTNISAPLAIIQRVH